MDDGKADRPGSQGTVRQLRNVAIVGGSLIIIGILLTWLVTSNAWPIAFIGALLLFVASRVIAARSSGALRERDHKVPGERL